MSERSKALLLVAPLLVFLVVTFVAPLATMLVRSVYDPVVADALPRTLVALREWDGEGPPPEAAYEALAGELGAAREARTLGQVAGRLNRARSGLRGVVTRTARNLPNATVSPDQPGGADGGGLGQPRGADGGGSGQPRGADGAGSDRPGSADDAGSDQPGGADGGGWRGALAGVDSAWVEAATWHAIRAAGERVTMRNYLNAIDLQRLPGGSVARQPEERRIYVPLLGRTLLVSLAITVFCLVLGYPLAHLIAHAPPRRAPLLLALVLVPFWTSLLVRTTSWIVILQTQGVVNDLLVAFGLIGEDGRLSMIYNMTGTLVAMTHVLLPFMILPLYSVMRSIPRQHMSAAASLGATPAQAFRRVYWPQTLPGVGAGSLLVFILAIGYYITPALVGGSSGQLISNMVAYHMQTSLNWGLAAALGAIMLAGVLILYLLYDRLVGVERMSLGEAAGS